MSIVAAVLQELADRLLQDAQQPLVEEAKQRRSAAAVSKRIRVTYNMEYSVGRVNKHVFIVGNIP